MKNFTQELKDIILKEDPGRPIMSPDEVRGRANTMVVLTNQAPTKLLALAGSSRKAILVNYKPLMITFPDQKGVYKVQADDIVFENHHTGRDVTEAGSEETSYEKFFASAMKKFGVSSPIELKPDETKKFFDYVDKNWEAEEESDGSQSESGWEDPPKLGGEPSLITPMEGDMTEAPKSRAQRDKKRIHKQKQQQAKRKQKREQEQAERERDREADQKEHERDQAAKEREREQAQDKPEPKPEPKPDNGGDDEEGMSWTTTDKPKKKKPVAKKKTGGLGIGSALKDLGKYTIAKAQSGGK